MTEELRAAILAAADAVDAARAELGRLDGAAGDGDHGMTMSIGARNLRRRFADAPADASPADLVRLAGLAMGDVGGAIGPLAAAALTAVAGAIVPASAGPADTIARLRDAAAKAERAIVDLGHAIPGDKTVIDALHPLAESLRLATVEGGSIDPVIEAAVVAAEQGAAGTADMVARLGRASRLGERSRGLPDAGATSFAIIVRAMADARFGARGSS